MMRSYQRVLTKCMTPARTKNGPKSLLMRGSLRLEGRPRLGDRETALIQRPADDHPLDVVEAERRHGMQIVERADPARIDQSPLGRPCGLTKRVQVGAFH